jgi:hypothetical protein
LTKFPLKAFVVLKAEQREKEQKNLEATKNKEPKQVLRFNNSSLSFSLSSLGLSSNSISTSKQEVQVSLSPPLVIEMMSSTRLPRNAVPLPWDTGK